MNPLTARPMIRRFAARVRRPWLAALSALVLMALLSSCGSAPPPKPSPDTEAAELAGVQFMSNGQSDAARKEFHSARTDASGRDDLWGVANAYNNIGETYRAAGNLDDAESNLLMASQTARKLPRDDNRRLLQATILNNLGGVALDRARFALDSGASIGSASGGKNIAGSYIADAKKKFTDAQAMYERLDSGIGDQQLERIGVRANIASADWLLARVSGDKSVWNRASSEFESVIVDGEKWRDDPYAHSVMMEVAAAHVNLGRMLEERLGDKQGAVQPKDVRAHYRAALDLDKVARHYVGVASDLRLLAAFERKYGKPEWACDYSRRAGHVQVRLGRLENARADFTFALDLARVLNAPTVRAILEDIAQLDALREKPDTAEPDTAELAPGTPDADDGDQER